MPDARVHPQPVGLVDPCMLAAVGRGGAPPGELPLPRRPAPISISMISIASIICIISIISTSSMCYLHY